MAQEIVGLKIQVDGSDATKSVGSLKQQLREAQKEVAQLSDKFGATSQEAVQAAKKAAELKDRIGDAKNLTDAFNPDAKFRAFTSTLSGVAGGFAAVQGALGLVGVESDKVEKTLLKVQSAMAISQGLQTLGESIDSFKQLGAVIQSTTLFQKAYNIATVAAAAVQRAFGVAVATTSTAFKALRGAILATGIGALVIGVGLLVDKIIDWTNRTSENEKALKKQAEATKILNQDIDNQIAILTALGGQEAKIAELRKQQINNNLNDLRNSLKTKGKLNEEEKAQYRKLYTELKVIDIEESNRIKKQQEDDAKARNEIYQKQREAQLEQDRKIKERRQQIREDEFQRLKDEDELAANEKRKREEYDANLKIERENRIAQGVANVQDWALKKTKENSDAAILIAKNEAELKRQQLFETANAIQSLTTIVGKDTLAGKALGIATALINTYQGASEAIKQKSTLPSPFDVITKVANVGAIIATGLKTVKAITSVQVPGVGGGSSTPSTPSVSATAPITPTESLTNVRTQLQATTIQQLGSATNRAYVLESDVTNSQERIRRINRAARLG